LAYRLRRHVEFPRGVYNGGVRLTADNNHKFLTSIYGEHTGDPYGPYLTNPRYAVKIFFNIYFTILYEGLRPICLTGRSDLPNFHFHR
jgi:hypothetical protein